MTTVETQVVVNRKIRRVGVVVDRVLSSKTEAGNLVANQVCAEVEPAQGASRPAQEIQVIVIGNGPELAGPGLPHGGLVNLDERVAKP